ncbi:MAG: hypothetical protein ABIR18_12490, partial [Chitinophagaceae bacterium]
GVINLEKCKSLRKLNIIKYPFSDQSVQQLKQLEILTINQPLKLNDLNFVKGFKNLKNFSVYYARDLNNISGLEQLKKTLTNLEFDHCSKISDLSVLPKLTKLEKIILSNLVPIPTLSWVKSFKKLTMLTFVDTDIVDGNIAYCDGIDFVGFNNKKKYNRTFEEMNPDWET